MTTTRIDRCYQGTTTPSVANWVQDLLKTPQHKYTSHRYNCIRRVARDPALAGRPPATNPVNQTRHSRISLEAPAQVDLRNRRCALIPVGREATPLFRSIPCHSP